MNACGVQAAKPTDDLQRTDDDGRYHWYKEARRKGQPMNPLKEKKNSQSHDSITWLALSFFFWSLGLLYGFRLTIVWTEGLRLPHE